MTARTIGQETFEAWQARRFRHPANRTAWDHPAVDESRGAWEDAGQRAIEVGAGPALRASYESAREARELLARVRLILANGELSETEARKAALEVVQQAEQEGETT